jgi:hypothetical protein
MFDVGRRTYVYTDTMDKRRFLSYIIQVLILGDSFDFRGLHRMAQKVTRDVSQPIREKVAVWTKEKDLDFSIKVVEGKIISVKISHALTLAKELLESLREFFVHIAQAFGLKVIGIQRNDAGRSMSCAFEFTAAG